MDDQYSPAKSRENIEQLLQQQIDIILEPSGSENFMSIVDFIKTGSILVIFPIPGVADKRSPDLKNCIYYRPSYYQESIVSSRYIVENIKPKKVVLFYQDDAFGAAMVRGAKEIFDEAKIPVTTISYQRNDTKFEPVAEQIKSLAPDCIGLFSTTVATKILLPQLGDALFKRVQFFGSSDLNQALIRSYMQQNKVKCILSNLVPNPFESALPITQEFRTAMEKAKIPIDTVALEVYIGVRILIDVLKHMDGPINKDSLRSALEGIKNYDLNGLKLNFDPMTRQLSDTIWLETGAGQWLALPIKREPEEKKPALPVVKPESENKDVVPVQAEAISIGSSLDLSKSDKLLGNLIKNCLEAFFDTVNREKLLGARTVKIYILDDEYNPQKARANVLRLIKDHDIQALLVPMESSNLEAYLDLVNSGQTDVLFAHADSPDFKKPDLKNLINFSASSFEEGYIVLKYACKDSSIKKLILFYEAAVEGFLDGAKKALSELQMKNYVEVSYSASDVDYSAQVKKIKNESPDAIMFLGGINPALSLLRSLGTEFLLNKLLIGGSVFLNVDNFKKSLRDKGIKMVVPSLVPNPKASDLQIVKDFRSFARVNHIPEEPMSLQTYISVRMFIEIIKKIQGPVTKQKIIEVAEQFKGFDLGGITLTFDPQTRRLINSIWIDSGSDQWSEESLVGVTKNASNSYRSAAAIG